MLKKRKRRVRSVINLDKARKLTIRIRRTTTADNSNSGGDRLIIDTGGGSHPTITERAWLRVGTDKGLRSSLNPYQSNPKENNSSHPVVSTVTKVKIKGKSDPVLFLVHYAIYLTNKVDPTETESLFKTMDIGFHVDGL